MYHYSYFTMEKITIPNRHVIKRGHSFSITIPILFMRSKLLDSDKKYVITIEEDKTV